MGDLTANGYLYKPILTARGATELASFHTGLDRVDAKLAELDTRAPALTLSTYANNAAALAGGLTAGEFYKTSTGVVMVVY
jgi:hypothetical protein